MSARLVAISMLRMDGGTQIRAAMNKERIEEYASCISDLPPVVVFRDSEGIWLADGFHRVKAFEQAGRAKVPAEVRQGSRKDAVLHAVGANATHGIHRSNADKRRAVETLLRDPEWAKWSDRQIAKVARVGRDLVGKVRAEVSEPTVEQPRIGADGKARKLPKKKSTKKTTPEPSPVSTVDGNEDLEIEGSADPESEARTLAIELYSEIGTILDDAVETWPEGASLQPLLDTMKQLTQEIEKRTNG